MRCDTAKQKNYQNADVRHNIVCQIYENNFCKAGAKQ
jgi:hypothetical protein